MHYMHIRPDVVCFILVFEHHYSTLVRHVYITFFIFGYAIQYIGSAVNANAKGSVEMPEIPAFRVPFIHTSLVYRDHLPGGICHHSRNINIGILRFRQPQVFPLVPVIMIQVLIHRCHPYIAGGVFSNTIRYLAILIKRSVPVMVC